MISLQLETLSAVWKERTGTEERLTAVDELRHKYKLKALLSLAGLARSTFYYYLHRKDKDAKYSEAKSEIAHIFHRNKGRYGYRRITMEMQRRGYSLNHKTISRLMRKMDLKCMIRRARYHSYRGEIGRIAPNIIARNHIRLFRVKRRGWHEKGPEGYVCAADDRDSGPPGGHADREDTADVCFRGKGSGDDENDGKYVSLADPGMLSVRAGRYLPQIFCGFGAYRTFCIVRDRSGFYHLCAAGSSAVKKPGNFGSMDCLYRLFCDLYRSMGDRADDLYEKADPDS